MYSIWNRFRAQKVAFLPLNLHTDGELGIQYDT